MEGDLIKIHEWLLPLSWLYGFGVGFRNKLFDIGLLHQQAYDIPVISVGNITVGGTGKTPHVEYLIRLLSGIVKVGVLSRGYKRKTKGYVLADENSTARDIGDEPFQMKKKFDDIYVAVDANRREGISRLTHDDATSDVDVILLDDAFQHRYVKPGINILLVDYHRLIIYDKLLPAGRLREPLSGKRRADIVIVTKCPQGLKPMEIRVLTKAMNLFPYQELFFTTMVYDEPYKLFKSREERVESKKEERVESKEERVESKEERDMGQDTQESNLFTLSSKLFPLNSNLSPLTSNLSTLNSQLPPLNLKGQNVLLLTGIASPEEMVNDLSGKCRSLTPLAFGDHHAFKAKDVEAINNTFASMKAPKVIITTEKDSTRLLDLDGLSQEVRDNLYVQPIKVKFMEEQEEIFNKKIISYVRKNSRNSILAKDKDARQSHDSHHIGHRAGTISFRDN